MNIELEKEQIIEQLLLVQDKWIVKAMRKLFDIDSEEMNDEHQFILNERIASYKADPGKVLDWEQFKEELRKK